jgi:hypothetical protein
VILYWPLGSVKHSEKARRRDGETPAHLGATLAPPWRHFGVTFASLSQYPVDDTGHLLLDQQAGMSSRYRYVADTLEHGAAQWSQPVALGAD